jgi:hypothetical protein
MSQPKRVLFRGVPMIEGWPEKIEAAQNIPFYTLNGRAVSRIRYGSERDPEPRPTMSPSVTNRKSGVGGG